MVGGGTDFSFTTLATYSQAQLQLWNFGRRLRPSHSQKLLGVTLHSTFDAIARQISCQRCGKAATSTDEYSVTLDL